VRGAAARGPATWGRLFRFRTAVDCVDFIDVDYEIDSPVIANSFLSGYLMVMRNRYRKSRCVTILGAKRWRANRTVTVFSRGTV